MNHMKRELVGHYVLLHDGMICLCTSGDGCSRYRIGKSISGKCVAGWESIEFTSDDIERVASPQEVSKSMLGSVLSIPST